MKFNALVRLVLILALCTLTQSLWAQNQPVQATWVAKDFKFHDGSVLPELRLAYTTLGNPKNPVIVVLHGTNGSGTGTITFASRGVGCTLQYTNSKWYCIGNNGCTFG